MLMRLKVRGELPPRCRDEVNVAFRIGIGGDLGVVHDSSLAPVNTLVPVSDSEGAFDRLEP
jgi:hypothetical protein